MLSGTRFAHDFHDFHSNMSKSLEKFIQTNKYYLECEGEGEGIEGVVSLRRHLAKQNSLKHETHKAKVEDGSTLINP